MRFLSKAKIMILFVVVVAVRLINITMPILEGTATRQIQTAMIARNLYSGGFNILYPQVDFLGPGPGYLVLEFPLLNVLIALLYKMAGGVYEWLGRVVVIAFFVGVCIFLYKIVRKLFNEKIAFISLIAFNLSPLSIIYSRTIMPDFVALFFSLGAIYFMLEYCDRDTFVNLSLSCVFAMFSILIKPQSIYIALPLAFLFWYRNKYKFLIRPSTWLYLIIISVPVIIWFAHARSVHMSVSVEELYNFEFSNWFKLNTLISAKFYKNVWNMVLNWALTPLGFALFFIGLFIKPEKPVQRLLQFWVLGVIIYYILFSTHMGAQPYYHLALVPVASIFIALSADKIFNKDFIARTFLSNRFILTIAVLLVSLTILRYALYAYVVPRGYRHIPRLASIIEKMTDKDTLIVTTIPDGHATLYYSHRKGWSFELPKNQPEEVKEAINRLEDLRKKGAKYFVSVCENFLDQSYAFKSVIKSKYRLVKEEPGLYSIYSLEEK